MHPPGSIQSTAFNTETHHQQDGERQDIVLPNSRRPICCQVPAAAHREHGLPYPPVWLFLSLGRIDR